MIQWQLWGCTVHDGETDALLKRVRKLAMGREDFMRQMEEDYPRTKFKFGMAVQVHDRKEIERLLRLRDKERERLGS